MNEIKISYNEFHVSRVIRELCGFNESLFSSYGNVILKNISGVRLFAEKLNTLFDQRGQSEKRISAGNLNAMGLLDEVFHVICMLYRRDLKKNVFGDVLKILEQNYGKEKVDSMLLEFSKEFPPTIVFNNKITAEDYLSQSALDIGTKSDRTNREATLEELVLLRLANENPAFKPFLILFDDKNLSETTIYTKAWKDIQKWFEKQPTFGPFNHDLITMLREPVVFSPDDLRGQLEYVQRHWTPYFPELKTIVKKLFSSLDLLSEEAKAAWHPVNGGGQLPDMAPYSFENLMKEYERFSPDREWMPNVVLMAKTILVWLDQLSKKYKRPITRLDQIPDEELDILGQEGFTGLWLIGLWERSSASRRVKQLCGNPEAAASAYSLYDYDIAQNIGGWDALNNLRERLWKRGIRLASDMVPNHTGMDSKWVVEKPDLFVQRRDNPFPQYSYNGENLSQDSRVSVYLEDHYYSKSDCAVVFKRVDNQSGDTRYIYHGNDGTGMPWNDTAQIDFLNPQAREEVIQEILHVARNFPIIRFDAAMVLAKKHIRRLWYPEPGKGGDIATRSETQLSTQQFEDAIPQEFWREVVDRVAKEVPDTLLLAEAFWMMEGYFVRTLGMHRVYNSAFMNMLKKEENQKYRDTVKNTLSFDPQVLKRFVNFMNNPDEETAVAQFGKDDKYFGVCTLMITMPGLPMFGHGQIEGFTEKYGMEYTKAYKDETPDGYLVDRHWRQIFPLMKKRYLFAQIDDFLFFDVWNNGSVNENIFAYSNCCGSEKAIVFFNNKYEKASGVIKQSVPYAVKVGSGEKEIEMRTRSITEGLKLSAEDNHYCIFKEIVSGLWYVRKCSDLCQNGMYVCLNGFETQVLMNIQEKIDGQDKKWQTLCDYLEGKGVPDLEIAWQELEYRDLYKAFNAFMTPNFVQDVRNLLHPELQKNSKVKKVTLSSVLKNAEENAIEYYEIAYAFSKKDEKIVEKTFEEKKKKFANKAYKDFCKEFKNILKLAKIKKAKKGDILESEIIQNPEFVDILFFISVTGGILFKDFAITWAMFRKCKDFYSQLGVISEYISNNIEKLFILHSAPNYIKKDMNGKKTAYALATFLLQSKYSNSLCGLNEFNKIIWFNKEKAESAINQLIALKIFDTRYAILGTASVRKDTEKKIKLVQKKLFDALVKSEYQAEKLVKEFEPEKKATTKKKIAKKVANASKVVAKRK